MDAAKGPQKITRSCPHPFRCVDVNLTNAVPIIIACPFAFTVIDTDPLALNPIVARPFIGIGHSLPERELSQVSLQGLAIGVLNDAQTRLSTVSANRTDDGRTIILVSAVPWLFVGAPSWGIAGIAVFFPFFPPHSETFHPFP